MTGLCISVATVLVAALPVVNFTLAWTHSIEKIRWEEDWQIDPSTRRLVLVESRIRGSGAGMEPPEDAVLVEGVWRSRAKGLALEGLRLARSTHAGDWELCLPAGCRTLESMIDRRTSPAAAEEPVDLFGCK